MPQNVVMVIQACLEFDSKVRPTFSQIIEMLSLAAFNSSPSPTSPPTSPLTTSQSKPLNVSKSPSFSQKGPISIVNSGSSSIPNLSTSPQTQTTPIPTSTSTQTTTTTTTDQPVAASSPKQRPIPPPKNISSRNILENSQQNPSNLPPRRNSTEDALALASSMPRKLSSENPMPTSEQLSQVNQPKDRADTDTIPKDMVLVYSEEQGWHLVKKSLTQSTVVGISSGTVVTIPKANILAARKVL